MEKLSRLLSSGLSAARSLAVAVLFVVAAAVSAQTVSISPKTGNVISALSYNEESHVPNYGGVWVHDQLPLTLLTSDDAELTDDGLVKKHANNVGVEEGKGKLGLISGHGTIKNHMTLSLPKGYRFTSYKIVLNYETWHEDNDAVATTFRETKSDFATNYASVYVKENAKKVTLTRTSLSGDDMGNILYFLQDHINGHSTVSVESFTITFECTDKFGEILRPDISKPHSPVACIALPFKTERVDLGTITRQTKNGYTSYKYDYTKVKDLQADFLFYDESGIVGGTAVSGTEGNRSIQALVNTDERTFLGLKNGTYWLEVPTDAQDGTTRIPVGYRIVGARVVYSNSLDPDINPGDDIYITDGKGRYMNADLKFTSTKVAWKYGTDKKVSTTSENKTVYLRHYSSWWSVSLSTTTKASQATAYETDGLNLYYGSNSRSYVISCDDDGNATYNVANSYAVVAKVNHGVSNTSFTIKLYDKTDKFVAHEATVNAGHPSGDLVLERINNDAIKLQVEGLEGDNLAYVCLEVQLEALNPYIDKMDIVCTQGDGEKQIKNHYLADDFTIGTNGKVDFSVPTNFGTENLRFSFEGLHSKNADETYGPLGTKGEYSRYHFVKSAYYNLIGENLQDHREEAADHPYADKLVVSVAGNKAFTCNNSDNFKAGMSGDGTFVYEENRYSNDKYRDQGGVWREITVNSGPDYVDHYLIVCDETRYNIAPTTTPRHAYYAYYSTSMRLNREDYEPVITYKRLYNNAMLEGGFDNHFYAGVKVTLKDKDGHDMPEGTGYVYAKQVIDKMNEPADGKPVDLRHVLYVDLSNVNTVIMSENDAAIGKLSDIKALVGENALIYLPQGVTASLDNVATKSEAGDDFNAENDIVLTDKLPFYSLYDIRVNANNEVVYNRTMIKDNNTKKWVSVVMPFSLALDPETGTYSQPADGGEFTFFTMKADNSFSSTGERYEVNGHFTPCSGVSKTEANKPYLVNIDKYPDSATDDNVMFTLRQRGTTIVKTPSSLDGETAQGTVDGKAMSLANRGTYSGEKIAKAKGVFYFNKDLFVSSLNLDERYPDVYVLPFRTWYDCVGSANRAVRYIRISTEPNTNTTNISQVAVDAVDAGFDCSANSGMLTVKATRDVRVSVRAINGKTLGVAMLRAGDSRTFSLPNGIYVVNGTKVMVR